MQHSISIINFQLFNMLKYLLRKELRQIKRNPFLPRLIFVFPFMVLLVFPWAASYEIKNLNISIVDSDKRCYFIYQQYNNLNPNSQNSGKLIVDFKILSK